MIKKIIRTPSLEGATCVGCYYRNEEGDCTHPKIKEGWKTECVTTDKQAIHWWQYKEVEKTTTESKKKENNYE